MQTLTRRGFIAISTGALVSACTSTHSFDTITGPGNISVAAVTAKINEVRKAHGRKPVTHNRNLRTAARTQAKRMAARNELSHGLGTTLRERVNEAGYRGAVGENLAGGHKTLEDAINGWLQSPGHRSTLLSSKFTEFGLAVASTGKKNYWALVMGGSFEAWLQPV